MHRGEEEFEPLLRTVGPLPGERRVAVRASVMALRMTSNPSSSPVHPRVTKDGLARSAEDAGEGGVT